MQTKGKSLDSIDNPSTSLLEASVSISFALLICYVIFKMTKSKKEISND